LTDALASMPGLIDALITGPFVSAEPQSLPWRGSDNQELHCLTDLGKERFADGNVPKTANFKVLDIMLDEDSTLWMAGIPSRGDVDRLVTLLRDDGFRASSTADRRA
jgi:anaerobic ribonucleoside-triphosphate reductase activating protein